MKESRTSHPTTAVKDCSIFTLGREGFARRMQHYNLPTLEDLSKSYRFLTGLTTGAAAAGAGIAIGTTAHFKEALVSGNSETVLMYGAGMASLLLLSTANFYFFNGSFEAYIQVRSQIQSKRDSLLRINS